MTVKRKPKEKAKAGAARKRIRAGRVIESFVIAEQIREEANTKKHTFIGVYNGNAILLSEEMTDEMLADSPVLLPLAFFIQYRQAKETTCRILMKNPKGEIGFDISQELTHADAQSPYSTITMSDGALIVSMLGNYEFIVEYDGKRDKRIFHIGVRGEERPSPRPDGSPSKTKTKRLRKK